MPHGRVSLLKSNIQLEYIDLFRAKHAQQRFFHGLIDKGPHCTLFHTTCFGNTLHLHIGALRSNMRIQTGSAGRNHFGRDIIPFQIRMFLQERIYPNIHVGQVFFIGRPFITAG